MPSKKKDLVPAKDFLNGKEHICIVGLGYVGLPLAVLLAEKFSVIGFDIKKERIAELTSGSDSTNEVTDKDLASAGINFSNDPAIIGKARIIIVTVPTPIDINKMPDLSALKGASEIIGQHLNPGSIVVYESTVYPGATEEECVSILEHSSGMRHKVDFFVGYSPERVNPGDKTHTIDKIVKVVSGDTPEVLELLSEVYGSVVTAGIHRAPSIMVAEAAKVIENTQRDINIALMNELAMIFDRMGIDTRDVLQAAYTKWNFSRFEPGLVGGHCIGVDPYYLTFKAKSLGFNPETILAGRRINDSMGSHIALTTVKKLIHSGIAVSGSHVLLCGLTFKENVPDIRNTRVVDIIRDLEEFGVRLSIYDPLVSPEQAKKEYGLDLINSIDADAPYDALIIAVRHRVILENYTPETLRKLCSTASPVMIDIKSAYDQEAALRAGFEYWRL